MDATLSTQLLSVESLRVHLTTRDVRITPVDDVSLSIERGEVLGIVGESGSGKTLTLRAIMGLLPPGGEIEGSLRFSIPPVTGDDPAPDDVRGHGVAMIFQEPMTALNPTMRVGDLVAEGVRSRRDVGRSEARRRAVELLGSVGIANPEERARMWPHELSGGLRQRVMIAAALATEPALLLCDEPTTALDVTIQDQILGLLARVRRDLGMAIVFVTHDLAVIAEMCDRIAVMYAGRIVELGRADDVLSSPSHPYTAALIASAPSFHGASEPLEGIGGRPPDPRGFPPGCRFAPRCGFARDDCRAAPHRLVSIGGHATACIHPEVLEGSLT
ncbi:MAG: ABC transporter ATP-binding protein [Actinomycetota bacterium]